jgi:hypothetical protein
MMVSSGFGTRPEHQNPKFLSGFTSYRLHYQGSHGASKQLGYLPEQRVRGRVAEVGTATVTNGSCRCDRLAFHID